VRARFFSCPLPGAEGNPAWIILRPETLVKTLEHIRFPEIAERIAALYNEEEDALLLGMLGQEYVIRHTGIFLHGQQAPETHALVILDYLFSPGKKFEMTPWRSIIDFTGPSAEFRKKVEVPITTYAPEIIARANVLLPMLDATVTSSLIGSDMAINIRALPKVYLHAELFQESQDFPAETWILFSNNAHEFVGAPNLQILAEVFKERLLSLLRIY
jgi:hypothetical protein